MFTGIRSIKIMLSSLPCVKMFYNNIIFLMMSWRYTVLKSYLKYVSDKLDRLAELLNFSKF